MPLQFPRRHFLPWRLAIFLSGHFFAPSNVRRPPNAAMFPLFFGEKKELLVFLSLQEAAKIPLFKKEHLEENLNETFTLCVLKCYVHRYNGTNSDKMYPTTHFFQIHAFFPPNSWPFSSHTETCTSHCTWCRKDSNDSAPVTLKSMLPSIQLKKNATLQSYHNSMDGCTRYTNVPTY